MDCQQPPDLVNGRYELLDGRTTYGAEASYSCGDDYNLVGETKIRCEADGKWTRTKTRCEIIKCPAPRAPNGGRVSGYNYEVNKNYFFGSVRSSRDANLCLSVCPVKVS